jgi:hypothetical protein
MLTADRKTNYSCPVLNTVVILDVIPLTTSSKDGVITRIETKKCPNAKSCSSNGLTLSECKYMIVPEES